MHLPMVFSDLCLSIGLCWSFRVLASAHPPLSTIIMAIVAVVPEGNNVELNSRSREGYLASKRAVAQVGREGYSAGFSLSHGRKLGANTLLLRDSWQPCILPYRPV